MYTRDQLEEEIKRQVESLRSRAAKLPDAYRKAYESKVAVFERLTTLATELDCPDLTPEEPSDYLMNDTSTVTYKVPREKLQFVRRALGSKMQLAGKSVKDAEAGTIWVDLSLDDFPAVHLRFEAKLAATDKCEIREVHYPGSTSKQLVCKAL